MFFLMFSQYGYRENDGCKFLDVNKQIVSKVRFTDDEEIINLYHRDFNLLSNCEVKVTT